MRSLSLASWTRTGPSSLQCSAKPRVNRSGMCWTMTSPGASAGIAMRNWRMASVPPVDAPTRSEEHTSELQSLAYLVCRLLLEKKKKFADLKVHCIFKEFDCQ